METEIHDEQQTIDDEVELEPEQMALIVYLTLSDEQDEMVQQTLFLVLLPTMDEVVDERLAVHDELDDLVVVENDEMIP